MLNKINGCMEQGRFFKRKPYFCKLKDHCCSYVTCYLLYGKGDLYLTLVYMIFFQISAIYFNISSGYTTIGKNMFMGTKSVHVKIFMSNMQTTYSYKHNVHKISCVFSVFTFDLCGLRITCVRNTHKQRRTLNI